MDIDKRINKENWIRNNIQDLLSISLVIIFGLVYFYPVLFGQETFFFRDILKYVYPEKYFLAQSFHEGSLPFWNPSIFSGAPFMALLYPSIFYPLNILLMGGDFTLGLNLFMVFHHMLLSLSAYALMRYWGVGPLAALGSAIVALFGGYFLSIAALYNHFFSAVWLPLIFLFFQKFIQEGRRKYFFLAIIFQTLQILGASPESCAMTSGLLFLYIWILMPHEGVVVGNWRRTLAFGLMIILALGLTAVQLVPTWFLVQNSVRSWNLGIEANTLWSMEPKVLIALLFPENLTGFMERGYPGPVPLLPSVYTGVFPLFFLFTGAVLFRKKAIVFWAVIFFTGLFFALGKNNPFYAVIFEWVPFMSMFRYPEKFFFLSAFALVFLTGFWLHELGRKETRDKCNLRQTIIGIFALGLFVVVLSVWVPEDLAGMPLVWLVFFIVTFFLWRTGKRKVYQVQVVMIIMLLVDLFSKNYMLTPLVDKKLFEEKPAVALVLGPPKNTHRVFSGPLLEKTIHDKSVFPSASNILAAHLAEKEYLYPAIGSVHGYQYADGLLALELVNVWVWTEIFLKSPPNQRLQMLKRGNVKYWITPAKKVKVFDDYLPRAFIVPRAIKGESPFLPNNTYYDEKFDPLSAVLLTQPINYKVSPDFKGEVESLEYATNRVTVRTRQQGSGFLVLLDSYFPGWKVKVDGHAGKILRANHFYRAVHLSSGNHKVEFEFVPEGFHLGLFISGMTLMLVVGGLFVKIGNKQSAA